MISFLFMKFFEPFSMIVLVAEIFLILDLIIFGSRELSKTVLSFHFPKMNIDYMNIIMCLIVITCVQFLACVMLFIYFSVQLRNTFEKKYYTLQFPGKIYVDENAPGHGNN